MLHVKILWQSIKIFYKNQYHTFLLSCVTTRCISHNFSSFSSSLTPLFNSACRLLRTFSCLPSSSSMAVGESGSSKDKRLLSNSIGGTYLQWQGSNISSYSEIKEMFFFSDFKKLITLLKWIKILLIMTIISYHNFKCYK